MQPKSCSRCPRPADFSLAFLVSTIGVRPRGQKCTQTVALCNSCLRHAIPFLASTPLQPLQEPLRDAYTALRGDSPASSAKACACPLAEEVHQGEAASSCRLCLIASDLTVGDDHRRRFKEEHNYGHVQSRHDFEWRVRLAAHE
jgi:hypothetical protein